MVHHGGNRRALARRAGVAAEHLLDFSANINPLGPPPWFRQELEAGVSDLAHYPDPACTDLRAAFAEAWGLCADTLVAGNGSSELLAAVPLSWHARRVLLPVPCYGEYATACRHLPIVRYPLSEEQGFGCDPQSALAAALAQDCDLVILGAPSNPAGALVDVSALRAAAAQYPSVRWLIDEAFIELCDSGTSLLLGRPANVAVLRSLTKSHACPGLRLGLLAAEPTLVEAVSRHLPPWSVNGLAQRIGIRACADSDFLKASRARIAPARTALASGLSDLGASIIPSTANFILFRFGERDGEQLAERLLNRYAIALRSCAEYSGLDARWLRSAVRSSADNQRLLEALQESLALDNQRDSPPQKPRAPIGKPPHRARALMLQGTSSGAGKSVLTTALCRILLQDGMRVCPFKAQNMSLNSGVTRDGLELGRAQIVQAQAARLEPDVRMNPVLLKPNSDTGSQIIVLGRPIGNAAAKPYMREVREQLRSTVHQAYDELASDYDVMVLEGAGSPGEVNLKRGELVNMSMARHAGAPVLLVGDIDRGGLYASFVGHMEVMEEWERDLVAGFIVNRFRGDPTLLGDAHDYVLRHTGKPVLGIVPFRRDLGLPEEDGVALQQWHNDSRGAVLDIALIELQHTSNFTDLDPLRIEADVRVRLVHKVEDLGRPDALIVPGSKNTLADLADLRTRGFGPVLAEFAATGSCEVVGLCGGLQMLGQTLSDPNAVESSRIATTGLGLLPLSTEFVAEKTRARSNAKHLPSGLAVRGYEIHHGVTHVPAELALFTRDDGAVVGARSATGRVWGTYLHGVFDDDRFRRHWLDSLRVRRGMPALGGIQATYDIDSAIDGVAALVRASLDMSTIRRLVGLT